MKKKNIIITGIVVLLVFGAIMILKSYNTNSDSTGAGSVSNVKMVDGKQEITIYAGQGYSPKITTAKAGMPTTLKIQGKNAYGCESTVRIPQLSYAKNLTPQGFETVEIQAQSPGAVINGTCSMGMYNFKIMFE